MHLNDKDNKIIIFYNASDIFLGTLLLILVVFFIHDYLSHALMSNDDMYVNQNYTTQPKIIHSFQNPKTNPLLIQP